MTRAIGFMIMSDTSPQRKQYTAILLEDGTIISNWGARQGVTPTAGSCKALMPTANLGIAASNFKNLFSTKSANADYTSVAGTNLRFIEFTTVPTAGTAKNKNAKIVADFHAVALSIGSDSLDNQGRRANQVENSALNAFVNGTKVAAPANPIGTAVPVVSSKAAVAAANNFFTQVESKILRPNGEQYHPREIMGHTDVALLRKFREKSIYVRLSGPPGAGKSALAEAAFSDMITVSGHGDMTVAHFVGSHLPTQNGAWDWKDGPLVRAMREGKALFVDEGTRIPTEVLNILFSVMDGRNVLRIDDRPDLPVVQAKKGFYVIMGYNPSTLGARPLDEALVSRFRVEIEVETDHASAKKLGVPTVVIRIAKNLQTRNIRDRTSGGPGVWVPQMREMLTYRDLVKMGAGDDFAIATLVASCPRQEDIPNLVAAIKEVAKKDVKVPSLGSLV